MSAAGDGRAAIAEQLRRRRTALGWTLEQVAQQAQVSVGMLSLIETDKRRPSLRSWERIRQTLGITESLPGAIRSGTLATLYAVAIACFGGSTQFILQWLIGASGSPLAPAWYMTGAILIGSCATLMSRESAPRKIAALANRQRGVTD